MYKSFGAILSCTLAASAASPKLRAQEATLAPGTALRIELDHRVRSHVGAHVSGHLTEPVYLVDHQVVPAGALVSGVIRGLHPGPKSDHVRRLLAADFTPPKVPDVLFDTLTLPAVGTQGLRTIPINAPAVQTDAGVLTLGAKQKKQSLFAQARSAIKKAKDDTVDGLKHHEFTEAVEKYAIGQLPYHPEILWSKTRFNADLATPATLPDTPHPT